jgi:hypothetical protein
MEGFGGSDTAREAEDGKRGGGRKLPATCLKGTQLPDFKDRKKPGKNRPSAEIVECEIGKLGGHENRRYLEKRTDTTYLLIFEKRTDTTYLPLRSCL